MEHKFVKFEDALEKLGISAERLNQLRENGDLRAYRDGGSWKFRADEIDQMVEHGIPDTPPPSDVGLVDPRDLVEASPLEPLEGLDDLEELALASDDDLTLDLAADTPKQQSDDAAESELGLPGLDDTVTSSGSDESLDLAELSDGGSDPSDSILLSDETLGEAAAAPPSTIIGKGDLEADDADLELVTDEPPPTKRPPGSSEVLASGITGSGVLDELDKGSGHTSAFEALEELELDLAAESSRILDPAKDIQPAAPAPRTPSKEDSDLALQDLELAGEDEGTDPIPAELEAEAPKAKKVESGPSSDLELATDDDDDFVLAEAGGSDITLDSADSGINLDPSDSGLALDDIPLEIGGSAILDSLSLGGDKPDADLSLVADETGVRKATPAAKLQEDDDFRLTPLGDRDEDGESSSQVIALDAGMEDLSAGDAGILGADVFAEEPAEGMVLTEEEPADEFGVAYTGPAVRADSEYSLANVLGLGSCAVLLMLGSVVMVDMIRNIWSWEHNLALNDSLLDSLLGMFVK